METIILILLAIVVIWILFRPILLKIADDYNLKIGLNINNLLNKKYKNYLSRMRYYAHDLGRNVILNMSFDY